LFISVHRRLSHLALVALAGSLGFSEGRSGVSVSFDHVVRPAFSRRDIDSGSLFLRVRNNSRASIRVLATAPEGGAGALELVHEIVGTTAAAKPALGWISPPEHYSPIGVTTTVDIQPHSDLLFSVPLNHVGPSWGLQLTFQFVPPKVRSGRQPQGIVDFTWADVPIKERSAWKSDSSK
jgi:hypothetical protein